MVWDQMEWNDWKTHTRVDWNWTGVGNGKFVGYDPTLLHKR